MDSRRAVCAWLVLIKTGLFSARMMRVLLVKPEEVRRQIYLAQQILWSRGVTLVKEVDKKWGVIGRRGEDGIRSKNHSANLVTPLFDIGKVWLFVFDGPTVSLRSPYCALGEILEQNSHDSS